MVGEDPIERVNEGLRGLVAHLKEGNKRLLQEVLDCYSIPAGIIRGKKIYLVNMAFCYETGFVSEEILGRNYSQFLEGNSKAINSFFVQTSEPMEQRIIVRTKRRNLRYDLRRKVLEIFPGRYFTYFELHTPGLLDSLRTPSKKRKLLEFLKQNEEQRRREERAQIEEEARKKADEARELADDLLKS